MGSRLKHFASLSSFVERLNRYIGGGTKWGIGLKICGPLIRLRSWILRPRRSMGQMGRVEHLTLTSGDVNCCLLRRGDAIRSARDQLAGINHSGDCATDCPLVF
jgi:hypothetical protein